MRQSVWYNVGDNYYNMVERDFSTTIDDYTTSKFTLSHFLYTFQRVVLQSSFFSHNKIRILESVLYLFFFLKLTCFDGAISVKHNS